MTELGHTSDIDLINQCRDDIQGIAFEVLYHRYNPCVTRFLNSLRLGLYVQDREDIAQETWEKVSTNLHSFDTNKSFINWIYQIAKTTSFNVINSRRTEKRGGEVIFQPMDGDSDTISEDRRTGRKATSPLDVLIHREQLEEVKRAISRLPEDEQAAIYYVCDRGLTYKEASDITEVSVAALRKRVSRARSKIKRVLS
jgi:RNA polymerase sigma-70 factor (ECF subfamily)